MKIYDNGAIMLGKAKDIIKYGELATGEIDNYYDIFKELNELIEIDENMIVSINYENPMGHLITYWREDDEVDIEARKEEFTEYLFHVQQVYDEWINLEENRNISYGELLNLQNMTRAELEEMENTLYEKIEELENKEV